MTHPSQWPGCFPTQESEMQGNSRDGAEAEEGKGLQKSRGVGSGACVCRVNALTLPAREK